MARSFNGTSDIITISSITMPSTFTMAAWWKNTSGGVSPALGSINNTLSIQTRPDANLVQWHTAGSNNNGSNAMANNTWHSGVAVVTTNSSLTAYLDGVVDFSGAVSVTSGTFSIFVGGDTGNGSFLAGSIADVALWNTALSAGQALSLANGVRPINVNSANLIFWLPLDGYASPEPDLSGNSNNGALTGTAGAVGPPKVWRIAAG